jgi:hypothetical protein
MFNTTAYNNINLIRENNHGGGIVVGISKQLIFRNISDIIPQELKSLEMLLI